MYKTTLTIFTPTYNRGDKLKKLYNSLKEQEDKDFIWHIVDDGSSDNTKDVVESFIAENVIKIIYTYQKNSGKYVAHNNSVRMCTTELFACVDSDDWFLPHAIKKTKSVWQTIRHNKQICGIVSPKKMTGVTGFVDAPQMGTLMDLYNKGHFIGETMLAFRSEVLKAYLFPEIHGERFMTESVIYNQIDQKYILYYDNTFLCEAEYLEDGLTRNAGTLQFKNPQSTLVSYNNTAAFQKDLLKAVKSYSSYLAWKKVMNISAVRTSYQVSFKVKFLGALLFWHYYRLFKNQKSKFEESYNGK